MAKDVRRAQRIANVLGLLERSGRRDLAEAARRAQDAQAAHDEVLASLVADEFLSGPFVDLVARRLPRLAAHVDVTRQQKAASMQIWQGQRMRVLASERIVAEAKIDADRDREAGELERLLEILNSRPAQGSGKSHA